MGNSLKVLLSNLTYDNLKIATLLLAIGSFLMFFLFDMATLSPLQMPPFDDTVGVNSNIFFTYFLDFSGVISSVLTALLISLFIAIQLVLISCYMNDFSKKWLFLILISALGFYGWVSSVSPVIKKFENKYLTSYVVGSKVYSSNYDEAYGVVGGEKISALEKAYLNVQISADQFLQFPNYDNESLLNADTLQLENLLSKSDKNTSFMDENVLYKVYQLSTKKPDLPILAEISNGMDREAYFYAFLVFLLYAAAFYNVFIFRDKAGMIDN
jgi:hypothetical protein